MAFFKKIRTSFKIAKDKATKLQKYENLPKPFLAGLPKDELSEALDLMVEFTIGQYEGEEAVSRLLFHEQIWYVLTKYDKAMRSGGLCRFYTEPSAKAAPFVSDALATVGAVEMRKLFDDFNREHGISVNHLEAFETGDAQVYKETEKKYPFVKFDEAYYRLYEKEPVLDLALAFARKEIDK